MTRPSVSIPVAVIFLVANAASAANLQDSIETGIEQFNAAYRAWDLSQFETAAETLEQVCSTHPDSYEAHYWLGAARFHIILHRIGDEAKPITNAEFRRLTGSAKAPLKRAVKLNDDDSGSHAIISTLVGLQIARSPSSALWRGPKSTRYKRRALRNGPDNPRAHYLVGTSYFHAPGILGGREKGLEFFLKAEKLFVRESKQDRGPLEPTWGYGSCLTFIGRTYQHMGQARQAKPYFRNALTVNPDDRLAQNGLKELTKEAADKE